MSATLADGTPMTQTVNGDGTSSQRYTLPLQGTFRVDAVLAEIDATAAEASPILTLEDKSGQVIATKRQSATIPAGDTGSATWARRLVDDSGSSAGGDVYKLTQKLVADAPSVVFGPLRQSKTILSLSWAAAAVDITEEQILAARFNGAGAGGDYFWHIVAPAGNGDQVDLMSAGFGSDYAGIGFMACDNDGPFSDYFSTGEVAFPDYAAATGNSIGYSGNGGAGIAQMVDPDVWLSGGYRTAPGPLLSLELFTFQANAGGFFAPGTFKAGSRFTVIGL